MVFTFHKSASLEFQQDWPYYTKLLYIYEDCSYQRWPPKLNMIEQV